MGRGITLPEAFVGLLYLAAVVTLIAVAARAVARRWFGAYHGVVRWLAYTVVGVCLCVAVHLVPAVAGILSRASVLVAAAALAAILVFVSGRTARRPPAPAPAGRRLRPGTATAVAVGAVVAPLAAAALVQMRSVPYDIDLLTFDLPTLATWVRTGSIWTPFDPLPLYTHGAYPQNGLLVDMLVTLPWQTTALVRFDSYLFFPVLGAAVYAATAELGRDREAALRMAALVLAVPSVIGSGLLASMPDVLMLAMFCAGVVFLLRFDRTGAGEDVVLAGLALGVAMGTKWYGIVAVPAVLLAWVAATPRARWRPFLVAAGCAAAAGGFWILRNVIVYGNPLYPLRWSVGGATILDAPRDLLREEWAHPIACYLLDARVMGQTVLPDLARFQGIAGPIAMLGLLAALGHVRRVGDRRVVWCGAAALVVLVAYVFNPDGTLGVQGDPVVIGINSRYFLPSVILGAVMLPVVAPRIATAAVVTPAVICSVALGVRSFSGAQFAVLAAVTVGVALVWRRSAAPGRVAGALCLAGAVWLGGVAVSLLSMVPTDRNWHFAADPAVAWVYRHAPAGARIGVAGAWNSDRVYSPVLALHGPRLENEVVYVAQGRGLMTLYPDRRAWRAAVERGGHDLLFVGKEPVPWVKQHTAMWARQEFGDRLVAQSAFFEVYDLRRAPLPIGSTSP